MIRHLVALRFDAEISEDVKAPLFDDLGALQNHIDGILDFQTRQNVSPEVSVVHGFQDLFWFDFRDDAVRDQYLAHPKHIAIGARLVAACEGGMDGVTVLDFKV